MKSLISEPPFMDGCVILDIAADTIPMDTAELTRALGYPDAEPPAGMAGLISSTAGEIHGLCDFQAGYRRISLARDAIRSDGILLENDFFRTGRIIATQLKGAEQAALMVCTLGPKPEARAAQLLKEKESALGFIADTAASVLAETLAETAHRHLQMKLASEGLGVTNRFSPGYCGWEVTEQHGLFRLLPEGFCGVRIQDSAFMQPRKSISAVIGIGRGLRRTEYPCSRCDDQRCLYRNGKDSNG